MQKPVAGGGERAEKRIEVAEFASGTHISSLAHDAFQLGRSALPLAPSAKRVDRLAKVQWPARRLER